MKKFTLLDKNRFKIWEQEEKAALRKLTIKKSADILYGLTAGNALKPFMANFSIDRPFCLKMTLKKRVNDRPA